MKCIYSKTRERCATNTKNLEPTLTKQKNKWFQKLTAPIQIEHTRKKTSLINSLLKKRTKKSTEWRDAMQNRWSVKLGRHFDQLLRRRTENIQTLPPTSSSTNPLFDTRLASFSFVFWFISFELFLFSFQFFLCLIGHIFNVVSFFFSLIGKNWDLFSVFTAFIWIKILKNL